jgi:predicted nucleotidyltransferase
MSAIETVARQAASRDAWLRKVTRQLENDDRVLAAWLVGSLGSGSADELSDIDIVVVVDDRYAEEVLAHSVSEVGRFGETVWSQDVPGNAPSGGAYVTAGFQSVPLPIAVDWYWQPFSQAIFTSDAQPLFHKATIPSANPPASFAELMSRRAAGVGPDPVRSTPSDVERVAFFWAMVPVAAKYAVRGWHEQAGKILRGLEEQVNRVGTPARASHRPSPETTSALQRLRLLVDEMNRRMPALRARGIHTPDTSYADGFMRLAEDLSREGWRRRTGVLENGSGYGR